MYYIYILLYYIYTYYVYMYYSCTYIYIYVLCLYTLCLYTLCLYTLCLYVLCLYVYMEQKGTNPNWTCLRVLPACAAVLDCCCCSWCPRFSTSAALVALQSLHSIIVWYYAYAIPYHSILFSNINYYKERVRERKKIRGSV